MLRSLSKRLERLEARILPTLEAPRTLILQFVTETGEVDSTMTVVLDQSADPNRVRPQIQTTFPASGHPMNRRYRR